METKKVFTVYYYRVCPINKSLFFVILLAANLTGLLKI